MKTSLISRITTVSLLAFSVSTALAQVNGSALDHMLQRPRVTKQYAGKKPFDHLFLDMGGGVNLMGTRHPKAGGLGQFYIGDWFTPEHGMRLGLDAGYSRVASIKSKYAGLSLDYMMNISALAQRGTTYSPRPFEVYGIAGVDMAMSRCKGHGEYGVGAHFGLRGQAALSPFTYFYLEPKVGFEGDQISQAYTWRNYRTRASMTAGFGYRLSGSRLHGTGYSYPRFTDGLFVGAAAGPAFLANVDGKLMGDAGIRLMGSIGRWFDNYNALRLSANVTMVKQPADNKVKAFGAQFDYMLNLHNAIGGIDLERRFWFNGVAGVSYNYTTDAMRVHRHVLGGGLGMQANLRLTRELCFMVEPRVDLYGDGYAQHASSLREKVDVVPSLLAGLSYTCHGRSLTAKPADEFRSLGWHDHTFIEAGAGANLLVARGPLTDARHYLMPQIYVGAGKWFTPVSGMRLWGQVAKTQWSDAGDRYTHFTVGADYLLNLTNAFYGYRSDRPLDFAFALGANLSRRATRRTPYVGLDASLRGTWHVSRLVGLFVEPRLLAYPDGYMPTSLSTTGIDFLANANVGLQCNLDGYGRGASQGAVRDNDGWRRGGFTLAAGLANRVGQLRVWEKYSPIARLSYTQWFSPYTAWRASLQGMVTRKEGLTRYGQVQAGGDIIVDLTSYTYGYDASRPLAVRVLAGANLGADYGSRHATFAPDLHMGGQLALRLTDAVHLVAEPQLACNLSSRFAHRRRQRLMPQLLVGLDYSMPRSSGNAGLREAPRHPNVLSVSMGTGVSSETFGGRRGLGSRLSYVADVSYGRWLDGVNGVRGGLSNSLIQRNGKGHENLTSIHAGYMMNIKSAVTGENTDAHMFQLTGIAAASLNIASWKGHDARVAPGLAGALQAGVRVSPGVELYLEPSATLLSRKIALTPKNHPIESELKLTLGTKVHF